MARPPIEITDSMVEMVEDYLMNYNSEEHGDVIPQMASIALLLGVNKTTLYEWIAKEDHPLSNTLRKCKAKQEQALLNGGLLSTFNAQITKLALHNHGYSDKQETTLDAAVTDVTALTREERAARIAALQGK